jgi:hypothetical protein
VNLSELHRRLLADVLDIGTPYPLVITGRYAVQAHGLVDRLSQDLDVATQNPAPISEIVRTVSNGLTSVAGTSTRSKPERSPADSSPPIPPQVNSARSTY